MKRRRVDLERDYDQLLEMERRSWKINFPGEIFFERSFYQTLSNGLRTDEMFIYLSEDQLVGWLWLDLQMRERRAHIRHIQVAETHWGRGIGRAIMKDAICIAQAEGCRVLTLNVTKANARAMRLYAGLGFSVYRDSGSRQGMSLKLEADQMATST